ncbi:MAG: ATP-dependent DNA helicase [Syntrophales bacterium]|nr:ATP-dependent DNA helicase [Syntrophales bacterium]MDP3098849.1 ATP-dependent DNA helicase [Syntrophales bacterium]
MLQPYHGTIRNIACLFAHSGHAEEEGNRIYEIAAAVIAPDRPEETFASPVRYGKTTERDRHASAISREVLRTAPPLADVTAFLSSLLRETNLVVTLNHREPIEALLAGCGSPRVVDLRFAAEFFLPQADSAALKPLWEYLHGKPREKFSFTAPEAVALSLDLVRHICGRVLNAAEFPPAAALRFHLGQSATLFGDLFLHFNRNFRDYFGGLFDPSAGGETPEWKGFLEKTPPPAPLPDGEAIRKKIPIARIGDLYRGLAAKTKGYALRPSQIAYAGHVASALNDRAVLTIEAGTGTGKTQGYLIPVLEFLRRNPDARVAVSTYTKNLQEQIVRREIPLTLSLNRAYRKIPTALLKGKSNYLCAEKLDQLYDDALSGGRLLAWLYFVNRVFHFREVDGDAVGERVRFHLNDGLFFRRLQHEISARSGCNRRHIRCPAQVIAAEAQNARLIVTNHHKLALLDRDEILGRLFENCVIDEANHFEQAVRGAFAIEIASRAMADAIAYLESVLRRLTPTPGNFAAKGIAAALTAMIEFREDTAGFAFALAAVRGAAAPGEAMVLPAEHPAFRDGRLKIHLGVLRKRLKEIAGDLAFIKDPEACRKLGIRTRTVDRLKTALRDLQENAETLKTIGEKILSPGHVTAGVLFVRHWTISVRAVEVADILRDHLYAGRDCVIFTSATLRQGESFEGFRRAAGMMPVEMGTRCGIVSPTDPGIVSPVDGENGDTKRHRVPIFPAPVPSEESSPSAEKPKNRDFRFEAIPSPFDPSAVEISVPRDAVSGAFECKEAWLSRVAELLPGLIRRNRGRTLVLFASYGDLEAISMRVADEIRADGYPLLLQQSGVPTASLCDEFRAIRESVLFGVDTFWYGVDFPGETLTQVIITRLPFPHPQDPLQIARRNLLPSEEYWRRYRYETAIKLRQGIGRLIRSEADRGRVVILDARYRGHRHRGVSA